MQPTDSTALIHQARQLKASGNTESAADILTQIIEQDPSNAAALTILANIRQESGDYDVAAKLYQQATTADPDYHLSWFNYGNLYLRLNQPQEAAANYRHCLNMQADYLPAMRGLANALKLLGQYGKALEIVRRILAVKPGDLNEIIELGNLTLQVGDSAAAQQLFEELYGPLPDHPQVLSGLATALRNQGDVNRAHPLFKRASDMAPGSVATWQNLGLSWQDLDQPSKAVECFDLALTIDPGNVDVRWNRSMSLIALGRYQEGWREFEVRWQSPNVLGNVVRDFEQPLWDGSDLAGARILIHAEQGFGDSLNFIRYVPLVQRKGGRVIIECQPALKTLFSASFESAQVIARGDELPEFDLHCPMMSLPHLFGTTLETIPAEVPYLKVPEDLLEHWSEKLSAGEFNIGLIWSGGAREGQEQLLSVNRRRSLKLDDFSPLASVEGLHFYSLQKGEPAAEAKHPPVGLYLIDLDNEIDDFADTAAIMMHLDLIISVDTATAHLAGALGKPVWVLLRKGCWRWLQDRSDSPWYPTMKIFRQKSVGNWATVIENLCSELSSFS